MAWTTLDAAVERAESRGKQSEGGCEGYSTPLLIRTRMLRVAQVPLRAASPGPRKRPGRGVWRAGRAWDSSPPQRLATLRRIGRQHFQRV